MDEVKHKKWSIDYALGKSLDELFCEHNAAIDALKAAEAELVAARVVAPAEVPSDEELERLYGACCNGGAYKVDRMHGVRAVREAVEAPWWAEVERLRGQLAAVEKTATRPVKVRFDCAVEDVAATAYEARYKHLEAKWQGEQYSAKEEWLEAGQAVSQYLADHAVIDVPEGVPGLGEITGNWVDQHNTQEMAEYIYTRLTPYLQPSAAVDPTLCETPFESASTVQYPDYAKLSISQASDAQLVSMTAETRYSRDNFEATLSPSAAHRAGMWLLSFAASQGIDVRLPVSSEQPPIADADTLEQLAINAHGVHLASLGMKKMEWDGYEKPYKDAWIAAVTAILRAARPEINLESYDLSSRWMKSADKGAKARWDDIIKFCEQNIRYRVEVPESEKDTSAALNLLDRLSASLFTTREITSKKRTKWARMLAELDAAIREGGAGWLEGRSDG